MSAPAAGECWHDGKGIHVRIVKATLRCIRHRRPYARSDSLMAPVDFGDVFERCTLPEHPLASTAPTPR